MEENERPFAELFRHLVESGLPPAEVFEKLLEEVLLRLKERKAE